MNESKPLSLPVIVDETFRPFWREGMPEEEYHNNLTAVSSTGIRLVLKSPRQFFRSFVERRVKPATKAMNFGKAAHMFLLEPERFRKLYVVQPDFGDMRSSKNRQERDEWLTTLMNGAVVLTQEERDKMLFMIEAVQKHEVASNLINGAVFEVSGFFRDPETGLKCRIRPDVLREDLSAMPDLKTTRNASKDFFSREIWNHRYDVQLAFYAFGVSQIQGKEPKNPCFIAIENQEPFDVAVYVADDGMMSRGMMAVRKGLDTIKKSLDSGHWSGYQENGAAENISLPSYTDWLED